MNPKTLRRNTLGLSGEHDSEVLYKEICAARNAKISRERMNVLVLQPSGIEIITKPRADGK